MRLDRRWFRSHLPVGNTFIPLIREAHDVDNDFRHPGVFVKRGAPVPFEDLLVEGRLVEGVEYEPGETHV